MHPIFSNISCYPPFRIDPFPKLTVSNLVKALENKSPEQQRNMIGEFLYRLVKEAIEVLGDWIPQQYKELETEAYKLQAPMLLHKL
ncbi:hypothetical protein HID58_043699 [Brassica napus]|uniref:Uncharacterized protein n=1 Tax=Brassica napus TaxID=3708 RepID=A0ABQ8BHC4_BRANA|nr:hypothetical protein HID58_043699 [Brassica napus]